MVKVPSETIEKIRSDANIVDIISQYVQLKKSGKNLFAFCPFHEERTPSFSVSESKQIFHCFSCGRGGNVFQFLMDLKGISFPEAIKEVADDEGIQLPKNYYQYSNQSNLSKTDRQLLNIHNRVAKFYHHILVNTKIGQNALEYLHRRGLSDDTINAYNLGYAPQGSLLKRLLSQQNINHQLLKATGLFNENDNGELMDRFYNRVMYPIRNKHGKTIAFSGRILDNNSNTAKYLNSPETSIFHKGKSLFGFDLAKPYIRKNHSIILFEGFMDVMSAYQSGIKNGIASMGTSLTNNQIYQIKRISAKVYICYDGDKPGQEAINRSLKELSNNNIQLGVIQMPNDIDPDEYRRSKGEKELNNYIHSSKETSTSFKLHFLRNKYNLHNDSDLLNYINQSLKIISMNSSSVERDIYINNLVKEFGLNKNHLNQQLQHLLSYNNVQEKYHYKEDSNNKLDTSQYKNNDVKIGRLELAEQLLLKRMLYDRNVWLKIDSIDNFCFADTDYQSIYMLAKEYFNHYDNYDVNEFLNTIKENYLKNIVIQIDKLNISERSNSIEINDYVNIIMNEAPIENKIKMKQNDLNEATKLGDINRQKELTMDIIQLIKQQQLKKQA